jgi:hypothetical protein
LHNRFAIAPHQSAGGLHPILRQKNGKPSASRFSFDASKKFGAGEESRTLDLNLGKVALYQLSYSRM